MSSGPGEATTTSGDGRAAAPRSGSGGAVRTRRGARRQVFASIVRICLVTLVSCALYVNAPLGTRPEAAVDMDVAGLLLVLGAVLAWEIRAVLKSTYPGIRATEAVVVIVLLLILIFASAYVVMEQLRPHSFTEPLTRTDSVYFTVTVLSTVGFGDISAVSEPARILVTVQMLVDLLLIGLVAKVLVGAVQRRRRTLIADTDQ